MTSWRQKERLDVINRQALIHPRVCEEGERAGATHSVVDYVFAPPV